MSASAALEIVFEIRVVRPHAGKRVDRRLRERRAAEVRMYDDAGGVDHSTQRAGGKTRRARFKPSLDLSS